MFRWAIIFLVIGLVLAVLGFGNLAGASFGIAKLLFFVALALFLVFLVLGIVAGKSVKNAID